MRLELTNCVTAYVSVGGVVKVDAAFDCKFQLAGLARTLIFITAYVSAGNIGVADADRPGVDCVCQLAKLAGLVVTL